MMLFFLLAVLPLMWLGGALSADYGKASYSRQQVGSLVDAAAVAGASAIIDNTDQGPDEAPYILDQITARGYVEDVLCAGYEAGVDRHITRGLTCEDLMNDRVTVTFGTDTEITVEVAYTVTGLWFMGLMSHWVTGDGTSSTAIGGSASSTAEICDPTVVNSSRHGCVRPR